MQIFFGLLVVQYSLMTTELRQILAKNLRDLMRKHPDLDTQVKIRERSQAYTDNAKALSQSTIQRILACEVHTALDVLHVLARVFGVSATYLITDHARSKNPAADPGFALARRTVEAQILAAQFDMVPQELNPIALKQKLERAIVEWMTGTQPTPAQDRRLPAKKRSAKHPA